MAIASFVTFVKSNAIALSTLRIKSACALRGYNLPTCVGYDDCYDILDPMCGV